MQEAHIFKNKSQKSIMQPKIYKKKVLHEISGQPDQKLAVYNGFHPIVDAFSYFLSYKSCIFTLVW